jgi:hypothetical protein
MFFFEKKNREAWLKFLPTFFQKSRNNKEKGKKYGIFVKRIFVFVFTPFSYFILSCTDKVAQPGAIYR